MLNFLLTTLFGALILAAVIFVIWLLLLLLTSAYFGNCLWIGIVVFLCWAAGRTFQEGR